MISLENFLIHISRTTVLEIQTVKNRASFCACRCRPTPSSRRSALIATTPPFSDKLDWTHANGNGLAPGTPQSSRKASKRARGASYASKASKASTHFALTYRAPRSQPVLDDQTGFRSRSRCPVRPPSEVDSSQSSSPPCAIGFLQLGTVGCLPLPSSRSFVSRRLGGGGSKPG